MRPREDKYPSTLSTNFTNPKKNSNLLLSVLHKLQLDPRAEMLCMCKNTVTLNPT